MYIHITNIHIYLYIERLYICIYIYVYYIHIIREQNIVSGNFAGLKRIN